MGKPSGRAVEEQLKLWQDEVLAPTIEKHPERKERFETASGIELPCVYAPSDGSGEEYEEKIGFPGQYPYTRGIQPTMYRGRFLTMRQYSGFGTALETNRRFRNLLEQGQTGLSVAFDLPTQMGYDSDHAMAYGEVGKTGVPIDTLNDVEVLLEGIPLDKVSTSMTINATAAILLSLYVVVGEKQGIKAEQLRGTLQNDILKEYIARGTYIYPPEPSMRLITDTFRFCNEHLPQWNSISVSGYHIREAGSTAAQELAFTLANGITYVQAALEAGLDVDAFASRISFFFNVHNDFLEEVALPHPDRGLNSYGPAAGEQHRSGHRPVPGGRPRRYAKPPHQQHGRGAQPANGESCHNCASHPAGYRSRKWRGRYSRPPGWFLLHRGPHR